MQITTECLLEESNERKGFCFELFVRKNVNPYDHRPWFELYAIFRYDSHRLIVSWLLNFHSQLSDWNIYLLSGHSFSTLTRTSNFHLLNLIWSIDEKVEFRRKTISNDKQRCPCDSVVVSLKLDYDHHDRVMFDHESGLVEPASRLTNHAESKLKDRLQWKSTCQSSTMSTCVAFVYHRKTMTMSMTNVIQTSLEAMVAPKPKLSCMIFYPIFSYPYMMWTDKIPFALGFASQWVHPRATHTHTQWWSYSVSHSLTTVGRQVCRAFYSFVVFRSHRCHTSLCETGRLVALVVWTEFNLRCRCLCTSYTSTPPSVSMLSVIFSSLTIRVICSKR